MELRRHGLPPRSNGLQPHDGAVPDMRTDRTVILQGDARAIPLPDASVDAIVCDPPYGLEFMGKDWDRLAVS